MNRKWTLAMGMAASMAVCAVVAGGAKAQSSGTPHSGPSAGPQAGEEKAEEQFRNIQVLKGVPAEQIFATMQFITASLGVECDFCHGQGAFEKDDKKSKQTTRKMVESRLAIREDNYEGH